MKIGHHVSLLPRVFIYLTRMTNFHYWIWVDGYMFVKRPLHWLLWLTLGDFVVV